MIKVSRCGYTLHTVRPPSWPSSVAADRPTFSRMPLRMHMQRIHRPGSPGTHMYDGKKEWSGLMVAVSEMDVYAATCMGPCLGCQAA